MAYNARKTYNTQKKYSRQAEQLDTKIKGLVYQDQAEIKDQVEQIMAGWKDAATGGKWGKVLEVLDFTTNFIPGQLDDVLVGTLKAANYDRLRAKALKGLDLSQMQYLNKSAQDASFEIEQKGESALEDLKFGKQMKDVGLDLVIDAIMDSETMDDFMGKTFGSLGPDGEELVSVDVPKLDSEGKEILNSAGNPIMESKEYYIPSDLGLSMDNITSYDSQAQALQTTNLGDYYKVDNVYYKRLDVNDGGFITLGNKNDFLQSVGTQFQKPNKLFGEGGVFGGGRFLFGEGEDEGLIKTFLGEGKDVLTESKEDKIARQKYKMKNNSFDFLSSPLEDEFDLNSFLKTLMSSNLLGEKL